MINVYIIYYWVFIGFFLTLPLLLRVTVWPDPKMWVIMIAASLTGMGAQATMLSGFRFAKTGAGCVIMTLEVALTTIAGMLFLGQTPALSKIIGGCFIIAGARIVYVREGRW